MANQNSDFQVLVGLDGAGSIDGKSGKLIVSELRQIMKAINNDTKRPRITLDINIEDTQKTLYKSIKKVISSLKIEPVKIKFDASSITSKSSGSGGRSKTNSLSKEIYDTETLNKDQIKYIAVVKKGQTLIDLVVKQLGQSGINVGKVDLLSNAKGSVQSFTVESIKASGAVEKLSFSLAKLKNGKDGNPYSGFVQTKTNTSDSSIKTNEKFINDSRSKIGSILHSSTQGNNAVSDVDALDKIKTKYNEISAILDGFKNKPSVISEDDKQNVKNLQTDFKVLVQESKALEKASKSTAQKSRDKTFSEVNLQTMDIEVQKYTTLTHKSKELTIATEQLGVIRAKLKVGVNDGVTVKAYEDQLKLVKSLAKAEGAENYQKQSAGLKNFILQLEKYIDLNDRVKNNPELDASLNNMLQQAKADSSAGIVSNLNKYADAFKTTQMQVKHLGLEGQSYFTKLSAQMAKLGVYFSAATVMMGAWKQMKNMVTTVIELDKVVTDLQVATGYTRVETQALLTTYTALAKELGSTTLSVAQSADTWLRQGHSIENSNKLIKDTVMLSKLGQIDATEAAKALTSSMKGYKLETSEVTGVVDKFAAIDMKAAVSAGYLAKAIAETATGARLGGVELDRLAGYIAQVGETTQD